MVRISLLGFGSLKNKTKQNKRQGLRTRVPDVEKGCRLKNCSTFLEISSLGKISLNAGALGDGGQRTGVRGGSRHVQDPVRRGWSSSWGCGGTTRRWLYIKYVSIFMVRMNRSFCIWWIPELFSDTLLQENFISCLYLLYMKASISL